MAGRPLRRARRDIHAAGWEVGGMRRSVVLLLTVVMLGVGTVFGQGDDGPDGLWYLRLGATVGAVVPMPTPDLPHIVPNVPDPQWHGPTLEAYEDVRSLVRDRAESTEGAAALEAFVRLLQRTGTEPDRARLYLSGRRADEEDDALDSCALVGGAGRLVGDGGSGVLFADGGAGRLVGDGGSGRLVGDGGAVLQVRTVPYFIDTDVVEPWALMPGHIDGASSGVVGTAFAIVDRFHFEMLPEREQVFNDRAEALAGAADLALAAREEVNGVVVVPHGHLVLHHMLQIVVGQAPEGSQVGLAVRVGDEDEPRRVEVSWPGGEAVVRIDLYPMRYESLEGLEYALKALAHDEHARIVMSWTLSNCVLVERYINEVDVDAERETGGVDRTDPVVESYASFLIDLIGLAREGDEAELLHELCAVLGGGDLPCTDSFLIAVLLAFLEGRSESDAGVSPDDVQVLRRVFAAAGNHRLPFPLPPASWPHVHGVAACMPTLPGNAWFTNRGDVVPDEHVLAPGAWYPVRAETDRENLLGYWGTSFAAPYAALAFTADAPRPAGPHVLGACTNTFVKARYEER